MQHTNEKAPASYVRLLLTGAEPKGEEVSSVPCTRLIVQQSAAHPGSSAGIAELNGSSFLVGECAEALDVAVHVKHLKGESGPVLARP